MSTTPHATGAVSAESRHVIPPQHELRGRARVAIAAMLINAAACCTIVAYGLTSTHHTTQYGLISDGRFWQSMGFASLASVIGAVTFLMWLWRAYGNLRALGMQDQRLKRGWVIGGWFIPIANFVFAILLLADIDRASDPSAPAVRSPRWWTERPISALTWLWWAFYVGGGVVYNTAIQSVSGDARYTPTPTESPSSMIRHMFDVPLHTSFWTTLPLGGALLAVSALLAALMIHRITRNQVARFEAYGVVELPTPASAHVAAMPGTLGVGLETAPRVSTAPVVVLIDVPDRSPDVELTGQIEDEVEGGVWVTIPRACDVVVEVSSIDGTALQVDVADEQRAWVDVPPIVEPTYTTVVPVDSAGQRFFRVVDPSGGERAWTMRMWFEEHRDMSDVVERER